MWVIEFFLQVDLVIALVSLFTIIMLLILGVPVPKVLIGIFIGSLSLLLLSLLFVRLHESNTKDE